MLFLEHSWDGGQIFQPQWSEPLWLKYSSTPIIYSFSGIASHRILFSGQNTGISETCAHALTLTEIQVWTLLPAPLMFTFSISLKQRVKKCPYGKNTSNTLCGFSLERRMDEETPQGMLGNFLTELLTFCPWWLRMKTFRAAKDNSQLSQSHGIFFEKLSQQWSDGKHTGLRLFSSFNRLPPTLRFNLTSHFHF